MAHPNEDVIRRGYTAFAAGDVATLKELFADNIVWHVGGRSPITGDYSGPGEVWFHPGDQAASDEFWS